MPRKLEETSAETEVARDVRISSIPLLEEGRFVPGTLLGGRYRITGLLGRGGMGEVYRATDLTLGQAVALKFLPESAARNESMLERFHSEVRVARQVSHPNVCRVYDIGQAEGMPFISMEYVDGEDLASLLHRIGRLPAERAVEAARKICAGVAAAHSKGVIHRDLKPQNIMMNKRGEIVIMDFGLAAIADQLSGREARNGTPGYMAPEQLKGAEVTAKSDIYAVGLVLYELFTGKRAYEGNTVAVLMAQQEEAHITSMSSVAADINPAVEKVIQRCLDPDPRKRPSNALAIAAALPGGDPLAAALAAGETPSPELVAAGRTQGLALRYAVACLSVFLVCVFAMGFLKQRNSAFYQTQLDYPPDVLRQKARDLAASFGYSRKPTDSASWLNQRLDLIQYLDLKKSPRNWSEWLSGEAPVEAIYRESPEPLAARPAGDVTDKNPPLTTPGMVNVQVDGAGRLRGFAAAPYAKPSGVTAERKTVAEAVFQAAQLDINTFHEVPSVTVPATATDELRAWKGPHPKIAGTELTLEVGTWRGQLTYAKFLWPWMEDGRTSPVQKPAIARMRSLGVPVISCISLAVIWFLAVRNWKLGRGDRKGAFRLAIAQFFLLMVVWTFGVHAVLDDVMLQFFFVKAADAIFYAGLAALAYLALEPALRARWPHSIVTWSRVLEGRWRDTQVCAHVLIGAAVGVFLLTMIEVQAAFAVGTDGLSTAGGVYLLNGTRQWVAGIANRGSEALSTGLIVFFVIFGIRTGVRRDWLVAILGAIIFAAQEGDVANSVNWQLTLALMVLLYTALIFVLLRVGLVATIAAVFFLNALNGVTLGADWTTWYAPTGFATLAVILAIAGFAFYRAVNPGSGTSQGLEILP